MLDNEDTNIVHGPPLNYEAKYTSLGKFIYDRLSDDKTFIGEVEALTGQEFTYGDILERSVRLALWLRNNDIVPGDTVSYCSHNHKNTTVSLFATQFVGAVFSPFDQSGTIKETIHLMSIVKPKIILCNEQTAGMIKTAAEKLDLPLKIVVFGELPGFVSFRDTQKQSGDDVRRFQCTEMNEDDVALVLCSSGTTGLPKGVQLSHKSFLISLQRGIENQSPIGSTFITFSSFYWLFSGTFAAVLPLARKNRYVITPYFEEEYAWQLIEKYQVNFSILSSGLLIRMVLCEAVTKYDISNLKRLCVGGGRIPTEVYRKLKEIAPNCKLHQCYGMTELSAAVVFQSDDSKPSSCGFLVPGVSSKIIDPDTGKSIDPHATGEICWKHPFMFLGYRDDPVQTQQIIDSDGWIHSGDIGYFDEDVELIVVDRMKDLIKSNNFHIPPAELEAILLQHPGVKHAGVVGKKVENFDEHAVAFVLRTPGSDVTEKELCDLIAGEVSETKRLRGGVRFVDEMPITPSGKVMRSVLRKILNANV